MVGNLLINNLRIFFFFFSLSTIELHFQTAAHRPEEVTHQDPVLSSGFVYSGQPEKWRKRPYLYPLLVFILLRCCFCTVSSLVPFPSTPISSSQPVHTVPSLKKVLYWYSPPHPNTLHPPFLCLSLFSLRCVESVQPHPVGDRTQRRQPLIIWLPAAVQQQLQDLWRPADLHRWAHSTDAQTLNRSHLNRMGSFVLTLAQRRCYKAGFRSDRVGRFNLRKASVVNTDCPFTSLSWICLRAHSEYAHCHMS